MKVAVWGAGNLGSGIVHRLTAAPSVSELVWINRSLDKIEKRVIDICHGLAFAPTCHTVRPCEQGSARRELRSVDLLIVTLGAIVAKGETRAQKYPQNAGIFREVVIPALRAGFDGIVLVITNPVDLMARELYVAGGIDATKVFGLGTMIETSRLKVILGRYLSPKRKGKDVWAYAIGTHDSQFVPVIKKPVAMGDRIPPDDLDGLAKCACKEVARAAERVREHSSEVKKSSLHPIVEGAASIVSSIAQDAGEIFTVSVLDPKSKERLFYSMPCAIGRTGILHRYDDDLEEVGIRDGIERCCDGLRDTLRQAGSL
jgi:L-lactate dehydrogenase